MILKYFYDDKLAQASYLVGCAATGEALVVDPARNIQPYLEMAANEGLKITHITETHIHADFVSGSRELAAATGGQLYLSDMGTEDWKYTFAAEDGAILIRDNDTWMVGNIKLEVLHTPGHTPEHVSFLLTDTAAADEPMGIFTGDFLFVGDVGRPDLLEEAAGVVGSKEVGARQQFNSVERIKALPDYLQIWPGHGAGSACGKALGAIPSTTLGYEKRFNPAFDFDQEEAFVEWLLDGQPEAPRYFAQMKKVNKEGPVLLGELPEPVQMNRDTLDSVLDAGDLVIDLRSREAYAQAYIPGTINIPMDSNSYITYVGWFVDFEAPVYVLIPDGEGTAEVLNTLRSIGVDTLSCYFGEDVLEGDTESLPQIKSADLAERISKNGMMIVDVRGKTEYNDIHIDGATNIPLGYLPRSVADIPRDRTIVTQCASGYRSQIAASVLRQLGYEDVVNLDDDLAAWEKTLPVVHN
jgi:hydroxyacylglutathione hydrolase